MSELAETMKELDSLYANHKEAWPNEPLRLAAEQLISKYDECGTIDTWEWETVNSIINLIHSRVK